MSDPIPRRKNGTVTEGSSLRALSFAKRARGVSRHIHNETRGGLEIVEVALEIMRDSEHRDRLKAAEFLMKRFAGKEPEAVNLSVTSPDGSVVSPLAGVSIADVLALAKQAPAKDE